MLATLVSVSIFLAYGTTAAVARMLGAGDVRGALRQGVDGCWLALIVGLSLAAVAVPTTPWIVSWFGPSAQVARYAETYLAVSLFGLPAMLLVLATTGVLRGLQDTRTPFVVAGTGASSNVALNLLFVYGLGWGIAGSAIGTVVAQAGMAVALSWFVIAGAHRHRTTVRPDWSGVRRSFGSGIFLIVRTVSMRASLVVATVVATSLGTAELAAHQIVFNTWNLLALVLDAVAIAAQAMVGRSLGSGDVVATRALTRRMIQWGVLAGVALGVVVLVAGSLYARLFTDDPEVRSLVVAALVVAAVTQPLAGWVFVLDGVLIGAGDGRYLAVASVLSALAFLPAATAVMVFELSGRAGIMALWGAMSLWIVARLITLAVRQRGARWLVTGPSR